MNKNTLTPSQLTELSRAVELMVNSEMITVEEGVDFLGKAGLTQVEGSTWVDTTGTKYVFA